MTREEINLFEKKYRNAGAEEIIAFAVEQFGKDLSLATSLAFEDQVVTFFLCEIMPKANIFTLDTGRLFQETYDVIEQTNRFFNIQIQVFFPNQNEIEKLTRTKGVNSFYVNVENRKECCFIRKTQSIERALRGKKAWITGLRREQSVTRYGMKKIEWDETNQIVKFNPLADWTETQTIEFVKSKGIPYNLLQDKGYRSIGCAPCTRAVGKNEDVRAGRWWWETPESKECGLHK